LHDSEEDRPDSKDGLAAAKRDDGGAIDGGLEADANDGEEASEGLPELIGGGVAE
jgi:hypothetical protein